MTVVLSLLASLLWGISDFLGGTITRRLPATAVIGVSYLVAVLVLAVAATATGAWTAAPGYLGWAVAAGALSVVTLAAFYQALATGTMGVVAPIAGVGVAVPVVVGTVTGETPTAVQGAGLVIAIVGVVLVGRPDFRHGAARARPVLLAGVAAAGFGTIIVLVAHGSRHDVVMTLLTMRVVSLILLSGWMLAAHRLPRVARGDLPALSAVGVGEVGANACYAVAVRSGLLPVVAVLSSLYPAVTAVLAWRVHGERLRPVQVVGAAGAVAGVIVIAAGGPVG